MKRLESQFKADRFINMNELLKSNNAEWYWA